ncbi:hypothetical protein STRTUCAR8_09058 [Streptomyces turgidiscabies Car8]|uniref:Lipoprotein n=1 Tax=Streptomyces turgidiscabies (strain Car8) TaxID=698760 RepID=L7FEI5_STRT8|nr:hypothetical protein [Streptomyces turgidiscabies]ELP69722.1 hypothetical protein STRTUCAR8_09058 [Streptomyces turgidiscabies Car8]
MHRWTLALLTAGLLATTATGCSGDAAAVPGAAVPGTADAAPRRTTGTPRETLALAEQLLIKECMEKQGHEYWVEPLRPDDVSTRFPYVVDDPAWARAHGYGTDCGATGRPRSGATPTSGTSTPGRRRTGPPW